MSARGQPTGTVAWALLFVGGVLMVMPFAYMLATSLKHNVEVYELSLLPKAPTMDNYRRLIGASGFPRWFANSFAIATATTLSVLFFDSLAGYTLAKFRFRGRAVVFVAILSTLMIPTEMLVLPWYVLSRRLGWLDTYWGIMFPGDRDRLRHLPDEAVLRERARRAGRGGPRRRLGRVPDLVARGPAAGDAGAVGAGRFTFLGNWTAFLWPLISTTSQDLYTLPESGWPRSPASSRPSGRW